MWFAGYPADYNRIRKAWLASLHWIERVWLHGASDSERIEDALAPISEKIGRKVSREIGTPYEETQAVALEVLNVFFSFIVDSETSESPELVATANALLNRSSSPKLSSDAIDGKMLKNALAFIGAHISLSSCRHIISTATDADLNDAHRRWRGLRRVISLWTSKACQGGIPEDIAHTGRQLSVLFGGPCILFLIYLDRRGMGSLFDSKLTEAEHANLVFGTRTPSL
jgi:hypothetical protein